MTTWRGPRLVCPVAPPVEGKLGHVMLGHVVLCLASQGPFVRRLAPTEPVLGTLFHLHVLMY